MIDRLTLNLNETECNPLKNWQSFKNHLKKCLIKESQAKLSSFFDTIRNRYPPF